MAGSAKRGSKCAQCSKDFLKKESSIQCDACNEWFHSACQNVPDDHCDIFGKYDSVKWYCEKCNKSVAKLWNVITQITARQDKLDLEFEKLNKRVQEIDSGQHLRKIDQDLATLRDELNAVKKKTVETDTKVETAIEAKLMEGLENRVDGKVKIVKEDLEEGLEIERRKGNLVLHGVKETLREKPEDDGKEQDREMVEEILRKGLKMDPTRHVEEVFRIGRYDEGKIKDGKIRPIRIKVKSIEGRIEMLKRAKELKNNGFQNVYVAPDLTRKQQLLDKDLRDRLKKLRSEVEEGERNLYRIKSGKIIKNEKGKQETIMYQPSQMINQ